VPQSDPIPVNVNEAAAMQSPEPILVSTKTAAAMLGISRVTLYKLLNSGAVRAVKSGGRTLIPAQALRDYADALPSFVPPTLGEEKLTPAPSTDAPPPVAPQARVRMNNLIQVMQRTGLSRLQVVTRSSAGTFPRPSPLSKRVLKWERSDVDDWLADPANYRAKP
jgi:prophage regulatory protein